jgi:DNA-binding LytR/AlgR family response regulator
MPLFLVFYAYFVSILPAITFQPLKLTCAIVDDDELMVSLFTDFVSNIPEINLVNTFMDSVTALKSLVKTPPDLLIMDIQMPHLTGVDIVRSLPTLPYVIFVTSSPDYAVESYALDVADYLLKPVKEERFKEAINKAIKKIKGGEGVVKSPIAEDNYAFIKIDTKYTRVYFDNIVYIEAEKDFTRIFTTGATLISSVTLKTFEEMLPHSQFIRTHRSYLVNTKHIASVEIDQVNVAQYHIPLGITYKDSVLEKLLHKKLIK